MSDDDLPYSGIKVFDAAQGVAGPHAGLLLAQHGADVIKVEPPEGDWGRALGKKYGDFSAWGLACNRGKRSIALNFKDPKALEVARRLAREADVVLESYRPGVMARFGLDYDSVRRDNPNVIYLSVTGYGQSGPNSTHPVTDTVMQGYAGLMSINRDGNGLPQRIGIIAIDVMTGLYAFQAIAAALYKRAVKGGGGRYIDCSLMQSAFAFQAPKIIEQALQGEVLESVGAPVGTFRTKDGYLNINARRQEHFEALCRVLGCERLITDERFSDGEARKRNERALTDLVSPLIAQHGTAELEAALTKADVLNGRVNTYADILKDEHAKAVNAFAWVDDPAMGRIPIAAIPGVTPPGADPRLTAAPRIGEHSRTVLAELGLGQNEIEELIRSGGVNAAEAGAQTGRPADTAGRVG